MRSGLRHNFRASTVYALAELADPEFTRANGIAGSVMEYNAINIALPGERQGAYAMGTLGPYDYWAIEYGYKEIAPAEEAAELAAHRGAQHRAPARVLDRRGRRRRDRPRREHGRPRPRPAGVRRPPHPARPRADRALAGPRAQARPGLLDPAPQRRPQPDGRRHVVADRRALRRRPHRRARSRGLAAAAAVPDRRRRSSATRWRCWRPACSRSTASTSSRSSCSG